MVINETVKNYALKKLKDSPERFTSLVLYLGQMNQEKGAASSSMELVLQFINDINELHKLLPTHGN